VPGLGLQRHARMRLTCPDGFCMFDPGLRRRNVAANGRLVSGYGAQVHLEMQRVASYREDSLLSAPPTISLALSHSRAPSTASFYISLYISVLSPPPPRSGRRVA